MKGLAINLQKQESRIIEQMNNKKIKWVRGRALSSILQKESVIKGRTLDNDNNERIIKY